MQANIGNSITPAKGFYRLKGSFGCAAGQLEVALANYPQDCYEEPDTGIPGLCEQYLPQLCTGVFPYSTYRTPDGIYKLEIQGICSMKTTAVLECIDSVSCGGNEVQCSPLENQIVLQNGNVVANNSVVIIDGGASGNVTNIFEGNTIQIQESRNITIQSSAPNITISIENSTAVVQSQANATYLNTGPVRTCGDWIDYNPVTGINFTLTSTPLLIVYGSAEVETGDGDSTWIVPDNYRIQYVANSIDASYSFEYCLQEGIIYGATQSGQVLELQLMNVTSGSPVPVSSSSFTTVAVIYNHTNPVALSSMCGRLITKSVRQNDLFSLYMSATNTDGSSASVILAASSSFSINIQPTGCSGVLNNITFNITVQFANGTLIKAGICTNITTDMIDGSFQINNLGVCSVTPNAEDFPDTCSWGTIDSGELDMHFSGVCAAGVNSGTPVGGVLNFRNTSSISFSRVGQNFEAESLLTFAAGGCLSLSNSGSNYTFTNPGVCSARVNFGSSVSGDLNFRNTATIAFARDSQNFEASSLLTFSAGTCLSVTTDGVNHNYTSTGVCSVRSLTQSIIVVNTPGGETTLDLNMTDIDPGNITDCDVRCEGTGENKTLYVKKLCSEETQCEVRSDPPTSDPPTDGGVCFTCCMTLTCSDGDDGGGGDDGGDGAGGYPPPLPPVPPFFPFFPPLIPGAAGGGGGGGGGGPPIDDSLPTLPLPVVTNCSGSEDHSGGMYLPHANFSEFIPCCMNATWGWEIQEIGSTPNYHYICGKTNPDTFAWMPQALADSASYNVTIYNQQTTQQFTNQSTIIGDNSSQLIWNGPAYFGGPVYINGTAFDVCLPNDAPLRTNRIAACDGGAPTFENGFIITEDPPTNPTFPPACEFTCSGPSTSTSTFTLEAFAAVVPPLTVNGGVDACGDATPGNQYIFANEIQSCDGTSPIQVISPMNWIAGGTIPDNSIFEVADGGRIRRNPVVVTASSTSVTANGQLLLINVNAAVCNWSGAAPRHCTFTITNSAITLATSVVRAGITSINIVSATEVPVVAVTNILSPSLDVIFQVSTFSGNNIAFSFYVELMN